MLLGVFLAGPAAAWQTDEPTEVTVAEPTRMDWTFVVGQQSVETWPDDWLKGFPDEVTYDLYVPGSCNLEEPNGLILFISPTPRAMAVRTRWRPVCDELGLILAAPHAAGNTCDFRVRTRIVLDVLDDVRRKYRIDTDRTYLSGFSGGGRMTCMIGFSLPEYFGGLIPIGSGGEMRIQETWLQKCVADRLGVAFLVGAEDFNFCEITCFREPLLQFAGVRTKTWVIDGMDHSVPESPVLSEAVRWLDETIDERRQLAVREPTTRIAGDQDPPTLEQQAKAFFEEAGAMMIDKDRKFDAQMLLKGIAMRWPDTEFAERAGRLLSLEPEWKKTEYDWLRQYAVERCRGYDRLATEEKHEFYFPQLKSRMQNAILRWEQIRREGGDPAAVAEARERIQVLRQKLAELPKNPPAGSDK